jgi:hypothetical protein
MKEGEAIIILDVPTGGGSSGFDLSVPGMGLPGSMIITEEIKWREEEKTEKVLFIKRKKKKTINITGLRCNQCGYIELYAKE